MKAFYSAKVLSGPAHLAAPSGTSTLCGLPLAPLGEPIPARYVGQHPLCQNCARTDREAMDQIRRWAAPRVGA